MFPPFDARRMLMGRAFEVLCVYDVRVSARVVFCFSFFVHSFFSIFLTLVPSLERGTSSFCFGDVPTIFLPENPWRSHATLLFLEAPSNAMTLPYGAAGALQSSWR